MQNHANRGVGITTWLLSVSLCKHSSVVKLVRKLLCETKPLSLMRNDSMQTVVVSQPFNLRSSRFYDIVWQCLTLVEFFNSYRCKGLQNNSSLFSSFWLLHAANCLLSCRTALMWLTCLMILHDHLLRSSTSSFKSLFVKQFHCQLYVILWHALVGWKPPYTVLSSQES